MYVSMKEMLKKANQERYAVLAINCFNLETAKSVINAAEEMNSPIIVNLLEAHLKSYFGYQYLVHPIKKMAENSSVEVAINLDHGQDVAYVKQCLHEGFSSVMIDASMYTLKENICITKKIVEYAESFNASVEAEVGSLGSADGEQWTDSAMMTNVQEAIQFIEQTNIDCLAISYGSTHGDYPKGYVPEFNFNILREIKLATNLPLVLHGGSGAGEENIKKSIELGINKINVGSDFMKAQLKYLEREFQVSQPIDYPELINGTVEAGTKVIKYYIELVGSKNKSK